MVMCILFENFICSFTIENQNGVQEQTVQAPRIILEQQFYNIAQKIASEKSPMKVTLKRKVQVWDQFDKKYIDREYSVSFMNDAFIEVENKKNETL